jgi:hypothetical protein
MRTLDRVVEWILPGPIYGPAELLAFVARLLLVVALPAVAVYAVAVR